MADTPAKATGAKKAAANSKPNALVARLLADLSWLTGAAEQAGVEVPDSVAEHIDQAVAHLGG